MLAIEVLYCWPEEKVLSILVTQFKSQVGLLCFPEQLLPRRGFHYEIANSALSINDLPASVSKRIVEFPFLNQVILEKLLKSPFLFDTPSWGNKKLTIT